MSETQIAVADGPIAIPITLHFGGDIPKQGLDADEVAAVAEGMAKAVQFLSGRADDGDRQYTLHLSEVRPGSAIFQFILEGAGVMQTLLPVIAPGGFSLKQVGEVFAHAIKLLEFLKAKPPSATVAVTGDNNVVVTNSEGAQTTVNNYVIQVAGNAYFQEQAEKVVKPLKKPGRNLAIRQDEEALASATSETYPAITAKPINDNQPLTANTIDVTLRVRQPHLDGENSWKFSWGRNRITAQVRDKGFMEKVRTGEEEFRSGDLLRVRMRIEEQQKGGVAPIKPDRWLGGRTGVG